MKNFVYFLICLFLAVIIILLANNDLVVRLKAQAVPQLLINEIMYNPAGADSGHEWLEIINVETSTAITIDNNWRFNEGSNHLLSVVQGGNVLATRTLAIIADNTEVFLQDYPDYQGILIDSSFSLNNSTDTLFLSFDNGQTFFATTTYQAIWGGNNDGYTLSRVGLSNEWKASTQLGGSPGQINYPVEQANEEAATSTINVEENIGQATSTDEIMEIDNATSTPQNLGESGTSSPQDIAALATSTTENLIENQTSENQENNQDSENQNLSNNTPAYSSEIIINEILPNPNGSDSNDEFIELYNRSNQPVDLSSWQLQDNSTKIFILSSQKYQSTIIAAFGYFVVYSRESGIALNNGGDLIGLYQPNGTLLDSRVYFEDAKSGWSYAKNGGEFAWTQQPTPGQNNVIKTQEPSNNTPATVIYLNQPINQSSAANIQAAAKNLSFDPVKYAVLRINEFLPDPSGSDSSEWIELYNNSSTTLVLAGWSLDDAPGGSKPLIFGATSTIGAKEYLLINKSISKLSLNNDEDDVRLLSPDKEVVFEVSYQKSKTGQSYNYDELNEEWFWSTGLTPGQKNVEKVLVDLSIQEINGPANDISIIQVSQYDLEAVKLLPKDEPAKITGVITSLPGQLYKKSFYLAGVDSTSGQIFPNQGLEIYVSVAIGLDFKIGDLVEVEGKVSYVKDRVRLNLGKDKKIAVLGHLDTVEPLSAGVEDLQDDLLGALVSLSGQVVKKQSNSIYLDDSGSEIRVDFKEGVKEGYRNLKEGDYLTVAGILISGLDGYRLLPRTVEDIQPAKILGAVDAAASLSSQTIEVLPQNRGQQAMKYLFYSGGGLVTILVSLLLKLKFFS